MTTTARTGRAPTMVDVADAAGVSLKTVSRVVNGVQTVDPDMTRRVLTAVARLGYQRNDMARGLRSGNRSASIGLLIQDFTNPFYGAITAAVAEVALQHDRVLLTASSEEDPDREQRMLAAMWERRVDGLIVVPTSASHRYLRPVIKMGLHVVCIDRKPVGISTDTVLLDNERGAVAAINDLVERGHRRIAILADSLGIQTMSVRAEAARAALSAAGLRLDERLFEHDLHEPDRTRDAVAAMLRLRRPPTAFFCCNNRTTIGAIRALQAAGSTAAISGFDDFDTSGVVSHPVTLVGYDASELGRQGTRLLFDRINGLTGRRRHVVIPTALVERGSPLTRVDQPPRQPAAMPQGSV